MATLESASALLVHDIQKGILGMLDDDIRAELVEQARQLVDAFHAAGRPVVWIHAQGLPAGRVERGIPAGGHPPADFEQTPEQLEVRPDDLQAEKAGAMSAFAKTDLAAQLRERGVTQVVLTGAATGMGVESTARSAYDEGFHVTVAIDAVVDGFPDRHAHSLEHVFPSIGERMTVAEILAALPA